MKILQVTAVYGNGSVGKISQAIHENLLNCGHDSFVCCAVKTKSNRSCKNVFFTTSKLNRGFYKATYYFTGLNFVGSKSSTNKIIRKIKEIRPDIVHLHCLNDYYLYPKKLFKYLGKKNIKTLITMHCEHYYTGSCGNALNCEKWKTNGCYKCEQVKSSTFPIFDRTAKMFKNMKEAFSYFDDSNLLLCPCTPWLMEKAKQSIILNKFNNYYPIFNGADSSIYKVIDTEKTNKILFISPRFEDPIKGAKRINSIAKLFRDTNTIFEIVGDYSDTFEFENNIVCVGKKYNEELAKEYSSAKVTILLSKAECFPMPIVESLLCGTKVVAFKCGGPDNCFDHKYVRFVEQDNFESMKNEICSILNENYDSIDVQNYAQKNVSKSIMCDNYIEAYKKLLGIKK